MNPKTTRLTAHQVERILSKHGFVVVSQKGSHKKWKHAGRGLLVIVPYHKGRNLPIGTLRNIMKNSEIPGQAWTS
jgi:predicted RNA binding protein YcfA (HicA-like mRNA interferase family)